MSMVIVDKIGDVLPESVIVEILSWLPVKALLRYKTVSKSWYAIISSHGFISKHLQNHYKNNDVDRSCLLVQYCASHVELQSLELLLDENHRVLAHEVLYKMPMYGSDVSGPCDGLYYLYNYNSKQHALWNPATGELKSLPLLTPTTMTNLPSNLTYSGCKAFGFGLDSKTKDYKVVVIKGYWRTTLDADTQTKYPLSAFVYSLKTDSWRYGGDLAQDYDLQHSNCYTFVNGCYHWLGSCSKYENPEVIISFDMSNDVFQEIRVPSYDNSASNAIGIYCESLAFLTVYEIEKRFYIWALNGGIWTKKFSIGPILDVRNPIGQWESNKFILECNDFRLLLFDPNMQEIKDLGFQRYTPCEAVLVYKESLVSIKDSGK